jgi:hypothetical protein
MNMNMNYNMDMSSTSLSVSAPVLTLAQPVECPWPALTAETLTMEQKFWLADRINNGEDTAANLSKQYGLPRRLLYRLAARSRRGKVLKGSNGRPQALDTTALVAIRQYIRIRGVETTKEDILAEISREYNATGERRRKIPEDLKPISRRSQKRYVDLFIAFRDMVGTNSEGAMAALLAAH